jgi:hypothetical protein
VPSKYIVDFLSKFVEKVFGQDWPNLEDIFTSIDLSANTGHHLGIYSAAKLRTIRRALIARTVRMLKQRYDKASEAKNPEWRILDQFIREIVLGRSAFINMNWDTLVEKRILDIHGSDYIDYCCEAIAASFPKSGRVIDTSRTPRGQKVYLVKIHGSVNWLYCDSCRRLFWFASEGSIRIADQLLSQEDWKRILGPAWEKQKDRSPYSKFQWTCNHCTDHGSVPRQS